MNEQLIQNVKGWFHEKGIIAKSNPLKQLSKTQEEITETRDAVIHFEMVKTEIEREQWMHEIKDGIGDVCVTLIGVCEMLFLDFEEILREYEYGCNSCQSAYYSILYVMQANLGRARDSMIRGHIDSAKECIGEIICQLTALCCYYDMKLEDCLQQAYNVISKRKGEMIDGIFVKEVEK